MLLKQETEHDEIYQDTWEARGNEQLADVEKDVLSTVFCYVRYTMGMEKNYFGMENNLTLPFLAN